MDRSATQTSTGPPGPTCATSRTTCVYGQNAWPDPLSVQPGRWRTMTATSWPVRALTKVFRSKPPFGRCGTQPTIGRKPSVSRSKRASSCSTRNGENRARSMSRAAMLTTLITTSGISADPWIKPPHRCEGRQRYEKRRASASIGSFVFFIAAFVRGYEEPALARRFGASYGTTDAPFRRGGRAGIRGYRDSVSAKSDPGRVQERHDGLPIVAQDLDGRRGRDQHRSRT